MKNNNNTISVSDYLQSLVSTQKEKVEYYKNMQKKHISLKDAYEDMMIRADIEAEEEADYVRSGIYK